MDILEQLKAQGIELALSEDATEWHSAVYRIGIELSQGRTVEVTGSDGVLYMVSLEDDVVHAAPQGRDAALHVEPNEITKKLTNVRVDTNPSGAVIQMDLPSVQAQKRIVIELATEEAVAQLRANLNAPMLPSQSEVVEPADPGHLRARTEGWVAPSAEVICAYFRHFQRHFPEYGTDAQLAALLELGSGDRRIREYKAGTVEVPYRVWRRFLVLTGRAVQEITPVMAFMG